MGDVEVSLILNAVNVLIIGVTAIFVYQQVKKSQEQISKDHDWNRRRSAFEAILQVTTGRFSELRKILSTKTNIYDRNQTYTSVATNLDVEVKRSLDEILNILEYICLGIKHNVLHERILYDSLSVMIIEFHRWATPYIEENRRNIDTLLWSELETYAKRWDNHNRNIKLVEGLGPL